MYTERGLVDHLVDLIRVQTCGVDDVHRLKVFVRSVDDEVVVNLFDGGDGGVQEELCSVVDGVLRKGDGHLVGGADTGTFAVKGMFDLRVDVRFEFHDLVVVQDGEVVKAVEFAVLEEGFQLRKVFLVRCDDKRTGLTEAEVQLLVELGELDAALVADPALELCVRFGIPAVDDGAVGFGGAHGDVVGRFHQGDGQLVAGQSSGNGGAFDPGTDDEDIIHRVYLLQSSDWGTFSISDLLQKCICQT